MSSVFPLCPCSPARPHQVSCDLQRLVWRCGVCEMQGRITESDDGMRLLYVDPRPMTRREAREHRRFVVAELRMHLGASARLN